MIRAIKLTEDKVRLVYGDFLSEIDMDYTLPLKEIHRILDKIVYVLIRVDERYKKLKNKNIRIYEGGNHLDIVEDGIGTLGLLRIEDHFHTNKDI